MARFSLSMVHLALRALESVGYRFYMSCYRDATGLRGKAEGLIAHDRILTDRWGK